MPAAFRLQGVSKSFAAARKKGAPVQALSDLSLALEAGRRLALIGPDAAGKSTVLRLLAGLVEPDAGAVEVFGEPVAALDRGRIGYLPQGGALYDDLPVERNLALYAELRGVDMEAESDRIETIYRRTGLSEFRKRLVGRLSGGMRQKLALACALVARPPLLLLDEPSVGVDPVSRGEILTLTRELAAPGSTIVWTTTVLDEARECDVVAVLHEGRLRFEGTPEELAQLGAGRVETRPLPAQGKRALLGTIERDPDVLEARIEREQVRVLHREPVPDSAPATIGDGFARLLDDGTVFGPSKLAARFPQRTQDETVVSALGLTKTYGEFTAVHDVGFTVRRGEIFGLLGPNGAGKSTTFGMLCGLVPATGGTATVAGKSLRTSASAARKALGFMPQRFSLYGDLSVAANLRFVAGAYGMGRAAREDAIAWIVDALGLEELMPRAAETLPFGQRQRLAFGAALLNAPPVLFLDEPSSGVDPVVRREFWYHINAIAARGTAVVVTTHFMEEAENCDRLLFISAGEVIAQGTPEMMKRDVGRIAGRPVTLEEAFVDLVQRQRQAGELAA